MVDGFARLSRLGFCAAVALALGLTCVVLAFVASMPTMSDMPSMATIPTAESRDASGGVTDGDTALHETTTSAASAMSMPMNSMCGDTCFTAVSDMCTESGGLFTISLLALFLASRRDTFIALIARIRPRAHRWRQRRTPWTVTSPIVLCVLRV